MHCRRFLPTFGAVLVILTAFLSTTTPAHAAPAWLHATHWGGSGTANGQFLGPWGVGIDGSGNVYVSDENNSCVQKFTANGAFLTRWGSYGSGDGQFAMYASGVAVDRDGNVYVVDTGNHRVQKFSSNGTYLLQWGTQGSGDGQFAYPGNITVAPLGSVYVTDNGNNRIQEFDRDGGFVRKWGTSGSGPGQFSNPWSVAVDRAGFVYVADYGNDRVQKFTAAGTFVAQWGSPGSGDSQFHQPTGIAVDGADNVYVSDVQNDRVQRFTSGGAYVDQFGTTGSAPGQLRAPYSLAVGARGEVVVADRNNRRVQVFVHGTLPTISLVTDVPNDQGRQVRLRILASSFDAAPAGGLAAVVRYDVFRRVDAGVLAKAPNALDIAGWDFVISVPAYGEAEYDVVVPTLADSNGTGVNESTFFVRAATASAGVSFDSPTAVGHSVDNLSPPAPGPFTAKYLAGATHLHWGVSTATDFSAFRLYRGATPDFVPGPGSLVAMTPDTGYVHAGPSGGCYKLSAVDFNGNEGPYASVGPVQPVDAPTPTPAAFALSGARPNPAPAGRLMVHLSLPDGAPARLTLIDLAGRRVATRSVGALGAGWHVVNLAEGTALAPGVYLLELVQGARTRVARVAVIG